MTCRYINSGYSNFDFEYIGEFETEFNKFLEYESGAQVGSIDRKKQRAKISCYCPFKISGSTFKEALQHFRKAISTRMKNT
jgi:hypothetical protein